MILFYNFNASIISVVVLGAKQVSFSLSKQKKIYDKRDNPFFLRKPYDAQILLVYLQAQVEVNYYAVIVAIRVSLSMQPDPQILR